jgi:hypothetical protein
VRVKTGQASLARSIEQHGLLHPVVIPRDGVLIAGERRFESHKLLGRTDNPRRRLLPPSGVLAVATCQRNNGYFNGVGNYDGVSVSLVS